MIFGYMLWFLFPLWVLAGIADYVCHRRTDIEHTSGLGEAALHVLQAIEIGIPLLAGLFLEINALVLIIMIIGTLAHTFTALWDGRYTTPRRYISPFEQHIHSHLEYIPIVVVSLLTVIYWDELASPEFVLRRKAQPIPTPYVIGVLVPVLIVQGALLFEETRRTWRAAGTSGRRLAGER